MGTSLTSRFTPGLGLVLAAATLLVAGRAEAFCRSTTCTGDCARDENECKTTGAKLFWPGMCVGYSMQKDGTVNLSMAQVRKAISKTFIAWTDIVCDPAKPDETATIAFSLLDDVACHKTEYNEDKGNANIVLFQDNKWIYKGIDNTLAKTTVTFDHETGEIFDADIEINTAYNSFTISDQNVKYDLQAVVTHEVGHFIGLDHTLDSAATMYAGYDEGTTEIRTLEQDDIDGACAIYPPSRKATCNPEPRGGLAYQCSDFKPPGDDGCAISPGSANGGGGLACFSLLGILAGLGRARRRRSSRPRNSHEGGKARRPDFPGSDRASALRSSPRAPSHNIFQSSRLHVNSIGS